MEVCFDTTVADLCLTIRLGVVSRAHLEGGSLTLEEGLLEVTRKNLIFVENNRR